LIEIDMAYVEKHLFNLKELEEKRYDYCPLQGAISYSFGI
jgi:hypothetical protein